MKLIRSGMKNGPRDEGKESFCDNATGTAVMDHFKMYLTHV